NPSRGPRGRRGRPLPRLAGTAYRRGSIGKGRSVPEGDVVMGFMSGLGVDRVGRHRLRACTAAALVALAAACSSASSRGNARASTAENSSGPAPGAQGRYSLRSLHRTYGFSASGTILPPAVPSPTPALAVGLM